MVITKDTLIGDIVRNDPDKVRILMQHGLGCVGCPGAQMESVEEAASVHGLDSQALVEALNQ